MSLRDALQRSSPRGSTATTLDGLATWIRSLAAFERQLWFVVIGAMLVDVTLTVHGRQLGLAEQNPIARAALEQMGVLGLYALKLIALGLGALCWWLIPERYGPVVPLGLALPSLAAVVVNTLTIAVVLGA